MFPHISGGLRTRMKMVNKMEKIERPANPGKRVEEVKEVS